MRETLLHLKPSKRLDGLPERPFDGVQGLACVGIDGHGATINSATQQLLVGPGHGQRGGKFDPGVGRILPPWWVRRVRHGDRSFMVQALRRVFLDRPARKPCSTLLGEGIDRNCWITPERCRDGPEQPVKVERLPYDVHLDSRQVVGQEPCLGHGAGAEDNRQ